jgi:hypothetical protein
MWYGRTHTPILTSRGIALGVTARFVSGVGTALRVKCLCFIYRIVVVASPTLNALAM